MKQRRYETPRRLHSCPYPCPGTQVPMASPDAAAMQFTFPENANRSTCYRLAGKRPPGCRVWKAHTRGAASQGHNFTKAPGPTARARKDNLRRLLHSPDKRQVFVRIYGTTS